MADRKTTFEELQRNLTLVVRRTAIPRVHERIISRAGIEIDRVEAIALSRISDAGSMRVTELAAGLGVACSTAGRHAANLEEGGFVTRFPDQDDRRVTIVSATSQGVELIGRLRDVQRELLQDVLSEWATEDLSAVAHLLGRLGDDLLVLSEMSELST